MTREPTIPQPPFDIPPATRDETAPLGGPIRITGDMAHGKGRSHNAKSEHHERTARENLTAVNHQNGFSVDVNVLPLDKLFR